MRQSVGLSVRLYAGQQSQFIYDQMIERNGYVASFFVSDPKTIYLPFA